MPIIATKEDLEKVGNDLRAGGEATTRFTVDDVFETAEAYIGLLKKYNALVDDWNGMHGLK